MTTASLDKQLRNALSLIIAVLVAVFAAVALAGLAHADPGDDEFLAAMHDHATVFTLPDASLIAGGHLVCRNLQQGVNPTTVSDTLKDNGWTAPQRTFFMKAAAHNYCPDQYAKLTGLPIT